MTDKKKTTIIVDHTPHVVDTEKVTYAAVVTLAYPDHPNEPEITYSVTYKKGPHSNHEGTLTPGGSVEVKDGMEFRVHAIPIYVNATEEHVPKGKVTYVEIVTFAFPDFPQHPERIYSVTYKKGPHEKPEGILAPGGSVEVRKGMEFRVHFTGES